RPPRVPRDRLPERLEPVLLSGRGGQHGEPFRALGVVSEVHADGSDGAIVSHADARGPDDVGEIDVAVFLPYLPEVEERGSLESSGEDGESDLEVSLEERRSADGSGIEA